MKLILILSFFLQLQAYGQEMNSLLKTLETSKVEPEIISCSEDDLQKCAVDLCGPPEKNPAFFVDYFSNLQFGDPVELPPEVSKLMNEAIDLYIETKKKELASIKPRILKETSPNAVDINSIPPETLKSLASDAFRDYIKFEIDGSKTGAEKYQLALINAENESPEFQKGLQAYLNEKIDMVKKGSSDIDPPCTSTECKNTLANHWFKIKPSRILDELEKKFSDPEFKKDASAKCMAFFAIEEQRRARAKPFQDKLPSHINQFIEVGMADMSTHSKEAFRKYLQTDVNIDFGVEPKDGQTRIQEYMKEMKEDTTPVGDPFMYLNEFQSRSFQTKNGQSFERYYTNPMNGLDLCKSSVEIVEQDNYEVGSSTKTVNKKGHSNWITNSTNAVHLSEFSCKHLEFGEGILMHELGHVLSYFVKNLSQESQQSYNKVRMCVKASALSSSYVEEDMADVMRYKTSSTHEKLTTCHFLNQTADKTKYDELTLINPRPQDTHSSGFLRLLREAIYLKKIPDSCRPVIQGNRPMMRLDPCF